MSNNDIRIDFEESKQDILGTEHKDTDSVSCVSIPVCRICHLTAEEADETLQETGCDCRGSLKMCHQSCLQRWVSHRMTRQCEICHQQFNCDVTALLENLEEEFQMVYLSQICNSDNRCVWFAIILALCIMDLAASGALMISARNDFMTYAENGTFPDHEDYSDNGLLEYSVTTLIVLLLLTAGIATLWRISEVDLRRMERSIDHRLQRLRNDSRSRSLEQTLSRNVPPFVPRQRNYAFMVQSNTLTRAVTQDI